MNTSPSFEISRFIPAIRPGLGDARGSHAPSCIYSGAKGDLKDFSAPHMSFEKSQSRRERSGDSISLAHIANSPNSNKVISLFRARAFPEI